MAEVAVPRQPEDEESKGTPRADGETQKKESKAEERKRAQKEEREQRTRVLKREREEAQVAKPQKPQAEISFKDARDVAKLIRAIQDEKQVVVSLKEFGKLKQVLVKGGYELKQVDKMTDAQIVIAAQQILKNAKISQPQETDWQYSKGSPNRRGEEVLVREQIAKAQSLDEEQLIPEKVAQFLEIAEFAKAAEGGGPGTMEAKPEGEEEIGLERRVAVSEISLREIIARMKNLVRMGRNVPEDEDWVLWSGRLQEAITGFNRVVAEKRFLRVYDFVETIKDAEYTSENYESLLPDGKRAIEILNTFLDPSQRRGFVDTRDRLDAAFEEIYGEMNDRMRGILLKDLELVLDTELQGVLAGWKRQADVRGYIFGGRYRAFDQGGRFLEERESLGIIGEVSSEVERSLGEELVGIREWRATKAIYGVEERLSIELLTRPPARWEEVPERLANIYRFIESTDFTVEQLQASIQKAINMIETVKRNNPEGRQLLEGLNKELKAFQAFHSFRVTMERADMRPEKVIPVFESYFDNETWENFVGRFDRDNRGRYFIDANGDRINVFDVAEQLYFERLQRERVRMNALEELTKRELQLDTKNIDEKWIILKLVKSEDDFNRLKLPPGTTFEDLTPEERAKVLARYLTEEEINRVFANLSADEKKKLDKINEKIWGRDIDKTKGVINDWYEQNTLLGALAHLGERRAEMSGLLLARLREKGLNIEGSKQHFDFKEFEQSGSLESVDYNAYHFTWSLAWSDYDIIRIYGREAAGKDDPMIKAVAYNQSSFIFFGRYTDHIWEFLTDEVRGRWANEREVNEILRKMFPGKHHGLFGGNRTMVRFARFFISDQQRERLKIKEKTEELMREKDFSHTDPEIREAFRDWAERIVIAELIDSGEISFAEQGFSKNAGNIKKYEMTDLFWDREFTVKYFWKDNFQAYLSNPSTKNFLKINNKETVFYSGRNVRLWPWMTLAWRAHWEVENKHMLRLFNKPNLTSAAAESIVDNLVADGGMERKQVEEEKKKLFGFYKIGGITLGEFFGTTPFRRIRQTLELIRGGVWDSKWLPGDMAISGVWEAIVAFFKQFPKVFTEAR